MTIRDILISDRTARLPGDYSQMQRYIEDKVVASLGIPASLCNGTASYLSMRWPTDFPHGFGGLRFISSPFMADRVQYRFPRSKKKRIRKKWAKDPRNYHMVPWGAMYRMGDIVFAHPVMIERFKLSVSEQTNDAIHCR